MRLNDTTERLLRSFYYKLPPILRRRARRIAFLPLDLWSWLSGKKLRNVPPRGKIFVGSGDFIVRGNEHLQYLVRYANLLPMNNVLDIGCGIGRTAIALTKYMDPLSRYEGFDVVQEGVDWCKRNISSNFNNFHFTHTELINDLYSLSGQPATSLRFPYADNTFDVVFLFSVFTHMGKAEVQHYLHEIHRVLKPDGRCLGTYFLYTPNIEGYIGTGNGAFSFPVKGDGFRLMDGRVTAANIAFEENALRNMADKAGLHWLRHINGYWKDLSFKQEGHDFQDIVILRKV